MSLIYPSIICRLSLISIYFFKIPTARISTFILYKNIHCWIRRDRTNLVLRSWGLYIRNPNIVVASSWMHSFPYSEFRPSLQKPPSDTGAQVNAGILRIPPSCMPDRSNLSSTMSGCRMVRTLRDLQRE